MKMKRSFEALCELTSQHPTHSNPEKIRELERIAADVCYDLSLDVSRATNYKFYRNQVLLPAAELDANCRRAGVLTEPLKKLYNSQQTGIEVKNYAATFGDVSELLKRALIGIVVTQQRKELSLMFDAIGWTDNDDDLNQITHVRIFNTDNAPSSFPLFFDQSFSCTGKSVLYAIVMQTFLTALEQQKQTDNV